MEHVPTLRRSSSYRTLKIGQRRNEISDVLDSDHLKGIGKATDRGMTSITDDFDKHILEGAKIVKKYWESYQDEQATLTRKTGFLSKRTEQVTHEVMIAKFQVLQRNAQNWLNTREAKGPGDDKRQAKTKACETFIETARKGIIEVASRKREELKQLIENGAANGDQVNEFRSADAVVMAAAYGTKPPDDGSTDGMLLVNAADGTVAYAFKPQSGESTQMRTPNGAGTVREVIAGRFFAEIDKQCNLNFRWPNASIATIEEGGPSGGPGALIEGLPGKPCDKVDASILKQVPKATLQKLLLGNLASLQLDAKLGNAFIDTSGDTPDLRPSDGGAVAPNSNMLADQVLGANQQVIGRGFVEAFEGNAFDEPIADDIRKEFLKIDVRNLTKALEDEKNQCKKKGLDPDKLEVTEGCGRMVEAVGVVQELLKANTTITSRELMMAFHETFVLPIAQEAQQIVERDHEKELDAVRKRYPRLVPKLEDYRNQPGNTGQETIEDLWQMVAIPKERDFLQKLNDAKSSDFAKEKANILLPLRTKPSIAFKRLETYRSKR